MTTTNVASLQRTTQRAIADRTLRGLQGNSAELTRLQEQLSTGRQISRPSDNPTGTSSAMQVRGEIRRNEQWVRNADDGIGWLNTVDSTMIDMLGRVNRVRDLTLQGMSTGSMGSDAREAIAVEVEQLREHLLSQANATYLGRPIFGGTTTTPAAYDGTGTYVGNGAPVARTVGHDITVRIDITGPEAFGPAGADVFATLAQIADHLRTDPAQLGADLDQLDAVTRGMRTALGDIGARLNRIEIGREAAHAKVGELTNSLATVENIDLAETITRLQIANTAYQAALGATARVVQPSLMDFLR